MLWHLFRRRNNIYPGPFVDLRQERLQNSGRTVLFGIYIHNTKVHVGECDLRLDMNEEMYYAGNIGYRIYEPYRGNRYAYQACRILLDLAKRKYGMREIYISCSPENIPSKKTIERLGFEFITHCDVPASHWLYKRGEKNKNIYKLVL
ncbi:MAG: GNAT family N-acetyltransferase [Solobacterium sp.]|nr:GNAT family N-acetyltransferase [Solobacterium sp.]